LRAKVRLPPQTAASSRKASRIDPLDGASALPTVEVGGGVISGDAGGATLGAADGAIDGATDGDGDGLTLGDGLALGDGLTDGDGLGQLPRHPQVVHGGVLGATLGLGAMLGLGAT
jgi:hypothetical protein